MIVVRWLVCKKVYSSLERRKLQLQAENERELERLKAELQAQRDAELAKLQSENLDALQEKTKAIAEAREKVEAGDESAKQLLQQHVSRTAAAAAAAATSAALLWTPLCGTYFVGIGFARGDLASCCLLGSRIAAPVVA